MQKILLSNDDGVNAKGLVTLHQHLSRLANVQVIAPDRDRSGASNSLTLSRPLRVTEHTNGFWSVDGTPTDCVHLAITGLLPVDQQPDIVVSGINAGANLGDDVLYSGTVAAATEGRFLGYPGIAVSLAGEHLLHYDTAARVVWFILQWLKANPCPSHTLLNINVPDVPFERIGGIVLTRLGSRRRAEPILQMRDPRGRTVYWVGPPGPQQDAGKGTDFAAIANQCVSVTPLQFEFTDTHSLQLMPDWVAGLNEFYGAEGG